MLQCFLVFEVLVDDATALPLIVAQRLSSLVRYVWVHHAVLARVGASIVLVVILLI